MNKIFQNQKTKETSIEEQRGIGEHGMVASAVREATEAGTEILKQGGNAMDALVAVQFALSVVEVFNTGIGANGFILYYDNEKKETKVIHGHSQAPMNVKKDMFMKEDGSVKDYWQRSIHPTSVAIPGIMKAMDTALKEYGTMPLDKLIEPAVQLAENGFRVNWQWDLAIEILKVRMGKEAKKFFIPEGIPRVEGEWVKNKDLAKTLRILQKEGVEGLYNGEIGEAIVKTLQEMGGIMTKDDLRQYEVKIEEPVTDSYKGYEIAVPGPPSGGGITLLQILKILESLNLEKYEKTSWQKYYLLAETMRLAFSDKLAYMSDPEFQDIPAKGLLHPEYIKERSKMIDWISRNPEIDYGDPWKYEEGAGKNAEVKAFKSGGETTHFTAVDRWGNVAACTSSIENVMGSGIMLQ